MFVIIWQFFLPLIIFIVAYWKILGVIRRQAKIMADHQRRSEASSEPVAGTSAGTADDRPRGHGVSNKAGSNGVSNKARSKEVGAQSGSKSLSQAQINVVRTMVYVTVCFSICWMPMYMDRLLRRLLVMVTQVTFSCSTRLRLFWGATIVIDFGVFWGPLKIIVNFWQ